METRAGLLNERLIRLIAERWSAGGIAVMYVRLEQGVPEVEAAVAAWERQESDLFWHWRLGREFFWFVHYPEDDRSMEYAMSLSAERLRLVMDEACAGETSRRTTALPPYKLGMAEVPQPDHPDETEWTVFRRLCQAVEAAGRNRLPAAALETSLAPGGLFGGEQQGRRTIGMLAVPIPMFEPGAKVSEIAHMFDVNPKEQAVVIVREGRPLGLVTKQNLHQLLAGQFGFALYAHRSVERVMDKQPLVVDEDEPVEKVSQLATARDYSQLYDVVVTVREGQVTGVVSIRDILECITALRTEEARTANPLTGLPGNTGIRDELARRMADGEPFAVIYADLDYFKWFNDCYGFASGDALIRYLGELMVAAFRGCGDAFVGHVGGDDFIAVAEPVCAEEACLLLLEAFDEGAGQFYGSAGAAEAHNRDGAPVGQRGVTLSLSLLLCDCGDEISLEAISFRAAGLKKQAKAMPGSSCVTGQLKGGQPGRKRSQSWSNLERADK